MCKEYQEHIKEKKKVKTNRHQRKAAVVHHTTGDGYLGLAMLTEQVDPQYVGKAFCFDISWWFSHNWDLVEVIQWWGGELIKDFGFLHSGKAKTNFMWTQPTSDLGPDENNHPWLWMWGKLNYTLLNCPDTANIFSRNCNNDKKALL